MQSYMIKISEKADTPKHNGFSSNISFFIQRTFSDKKLLSYSTF